MTEELRIQKIRCLAGMLLDSTKEDVEKIEEIIKKLDELNSFDLEEITEKLKEEDKEEKNNSEYKTLTKRWFKSPLGNSGIKDGKWHHIMVTLDKDGNIINYIDGISQEDVKKEDKNNKEDKKKEEEEEKDEITFYVISTDFPHFYPVFPLVVPSIFHSRFIF